MLSVRDISKEYSDHSLFSHINFSVEENEVVGLVGNNGVGKSTLLQIIAGSIEPTEGKVNLQDEIVGYLSQYPQFIEQTVKDFLSSLYPEYEHKRVLSEVSLEYLSDSQFVTSLSGGEKTKLYLAKLLLQNPTFLLLDEPTNNLDLEGLVWLENFIAGFRGGILLTSHDRYFLDETVDTIFELEKGEIKKYGGNYSFYREQKEIEQEAYKRAYEAQQKKIKHIQEDIESMEGRARAGEKQFGSRMPYQRRKIRKSAQQMVSRKKRLEMLLLSEKHLAEPALLKPKYIHLDGSIPSQKSVVTVKELSFGYTQQEILRTVNFSIMGSDRIWLSGKNGSGKTTLLNILLGNIHQTSGSIEWGNGIRTGYFTQERDDLNQSSTVVEALMKTGLSQTDAYKLALKFNFEVDDLKKQISELSVGQRAKVSFALLTSGIYQFLILDEPTNHLEIETREVIERALTDFGGALLVVSHDRYFLEQIGITKQFHLDEGSLVQVFK